MHAGLERRPAPSSPVLRPAYLPYLSRYSAMAMAMTGNPYHAHTMPNTCQR